MCWRNALALISKCQKSASARQRASCTVRTGDLAAHVPARNAEKSWQPTMLRLASIIAAVSSG